MRTAEGAEGRPVAHVLLDSALPQLDHLFDYAVPRELADDLRVGQRVRVPFRSQSRRSHGYVVGFAETSDFGGELQPIADIVGPVPQLTPRLWRLARAVADRAGGSASDILRLAIPPRMVRAEKQHLAGLEDPDSTPEVSGPEVGTSSFVPSEFERESAELLLAGQRLAVTASHGPERLATGEWVGGWAVRMARTALEVFSRGRSAILVAPDYRDVDQLADALASLGHPDVVRVDSRQSGSARYASFLRALDDTPRIVLGNRSAIYAPAYRLGAILLWDDGDPLFSEPLAPYVHARDAALVRASIEHEGAADSDEGAADSVGLMFAAHARSVEVQRLVDIGYVQAESVPPRRTRVITATPCSTTTLTLLACPSSRRAPFARAFRRGRCSCRWQRRVTRRLRCVQTAANAAAAPRAVDRSGFAAHSGRCAAGAVNTRVRGAAPSVVARDSRSAAQAPSAPPSSFSGSFRERESC